MSGDYSRVLVILLCLSFCTGLVKKLSDVSYRLTPCGSSGRSGPSFQQCLDHYTSTGSRVADALNPNPEQQGFLGGQGFIFPSTGWYNVTVAGASGGRGLCNIWKGLGVVFRGQMFIEKGVNDSVMVMVGQEGKGPCDVNAMLHPNLCSNRPETEEQVTSCCEEWALCDDGSYGGGGGGGASMVWAPNTTTSQYSQLILPLVIAGGGGGTGVSLNYTALGTGLTVTLQNEILQQLKSSPTQSDQDFFIELVNGKPDQIFSVDMFQNFSGETGFRPNKVNSSGAGAGWTNETTSADNLVNGRLLSIAANNFANGGYDCISAVNPVPDSQIDGSVGGFGGAGGACNNGGAGGGYTGGSVIGTGSFIPGSGGFSLDSGIDGLFQIRTSAGNGYVEFVPQDCKCVGQCHIMDDFFKCSCTESFVAPDGLDCLNASALNLNNVPLGLQPISNSLSVSLYSLKTPVTLFASSVTLLAGSSRRQAETESSCAVIWLGSESQPVLVSDPVHSLPGEAQLLRAINSTMLSYAMRELTQGEVVTGGLLLTDGTSCSIGEAIANISIISPETSGPLMNLTEILELHNSSLIALSTEILGNISLAPSSPPPFILTSTIVPSLSSSSSLTPALPPPRSQTTFTSLTSATVSSSTSPLAILSVVVVVVVVLVTVGIVIAGLLLMVGCLYFKKHKLARHDDLKWSRGSSSVHHNKYIQKGLTSSLKSNPAYNEIVGFSSEIPNGFPNSDANLENTLDRAGDSRVETLRMDEIVHGYTTMSDLPHELEEGNGVRPIRRARRQTFTLRPKFGVMAPSVNFSAYNKTRDGNDWDYDRTQLTFLRELGEGQFGKVLLMQAKGIAGYDGQIPVAIKTLSSTEDEDIKRFLEEVDLMKTFCHNNIVSLLGVDCDYESGAPLMILEYMPYGDLHSFLVKYRPSSKSAHMLITNHHQMGFARDIANALTFLGANKYVHRDIAARNCLVGPRLEAKLADFGMARGVAEKDYYRIAGRAVLPVRWMAPESLLYGFFTSASDIWSYGVLLWEIASYGLMPLKDKTSQEIVEMAQEATLCHTWPDDYCKKLQALSLQCHQFNPDDRPEIGEIVSQIPRTSRR